MDLVLYMNSNFLNWLHVVSSKHEIPKSCKNIDNMTIHNFRAMYMSMSCITESHNKIS